MANLLIRNGANVNLTDNDSRTALHLAAVWGVYKNSENIADLIIKKGANLSLVDNDGKTALHWAAMFGNSNFPQPYAIQKYK